MTHAPTLQRGYSTAVHLKPEPSLPPKAQLLPCTPAFLATNTPVSTLQPSQSSPHKPKQVGPRHQFPPPPVAALPSSPHRCGTPGALFSSCHTGVARRDPLLPLRLPAVRHLHPHQPDQVPGRPGQRGARAVWRHPRRRAALPAQLRGDGRAGQPVAGVGATGSMSTCMPVCSRVAWRAQEACGVCCSSADGRWGNRRG